MQKSFLVNVNKPEGISSFAVVARLRKILNVKKIGHLGTLDPFATGVLPLAVGKATRFIQYLQPDEKEYIAEIYLGATSNTDDLTGEICKSDLDCKSLPLYENIAEVLRSFEGEIMQMPPQFSALKIEGKRAYALARKGEHADLKSRKVFVKKIELQSCNWPYVGIKVVCGKGVYIRSIARDLGELLGVGGYLTKLQRIKVGEFKIENALCLDSLSDDNIDCVSIEDAWGTRPKIELTAEEWSALAQGKFISSDFVEKFPTPVLGIFQSEAVCLLEDVASQPGLVKSAINIKEIND